MKLEKWKYELTEEESRRIDYLKVIAMIFVVYIHSYSVEVGFSGAMHSLNVPRYIEILEEFVSRVIATFAVPMYFLISSLLLFRIERNYVITIKNKMKTLLIPYLFWNSIGIAIFCVLQNLSFTADFFSGMSTSVLQSDFNEWLNMYGIGTNTPKVYPLWFLRDLIFVTMFYPVFKIVVDKVPKIALITIVILILLPVDFPFKTAIIWFLIGAYIARYNLRMDVLDKVHIKGYTIVFFVVSVASFLLKNVIFNAIYSFFSVFFWVRVSKEIEKNKYISEFLVKLIPWMFFVYVTHEPAMTGIKKICLKLLPNNPLFFLIEYLGIPIVIITGCVICAFMMKKYLPRIYKISIGYRI